MRCQEGSKRLIANEVMLHSMIENNISYGNCDLIGWMLVLYLNYDEKLDLYKLWSRKSVRLRLIKCAGILLHFKRLK